MKLTLKIKLLPTTEQADLLLQTIREANAVCNRISETAWETKVFNQFRLHKEVYYPCKAAFNLRSQALVRCIAKVADAYKLDKKCQRSFRPLGSIAYDSRMLSYNSSGVSIWSVAGRLKMPFVCHRPDYLPCMQGEADLMVRKGKFYLLQTVEVPVPEAEEVKECIGVDFGLTDIAVTSDGKKHSASGLNTYREKRKRVLGSIQRKGTQGRTHACKRSCAKLLKRLKGKERTTGTIINHTIAKQIIHTAKSQGKGVAIENLRGIRSGSKERGKRNKPFRSKLGRWSFSQLRSFLEYKAGLNGVKLVVVEPAYTSKTCSVCHHIGSRANKLFKCKHCGNDMDADLNAAINIATLGAAVNQPERSGMHCILHAA